MKTFVLITTQLLLISFYACSQAFLNKTKAQISNRLYLQKQYQFERTETDTTLTFKTKDIKLKATEAIYHFNKSGRCDSEAVIYGCEECYQERLKKILGSNWIKISDTCFRTKNMELNTHYLGEPFAYVIRKQPQ